MSPGKIFQITTKTFVPPHPLKTAVLFMIFNRPDTTKQVFDAIRKAKPPRLYVAADGPRDSRPGEDEKVKASAIMLWAISTGIARLKRCCE